MSTRLERRYVPKAANYTIVPYIDRPGTVFTNLGASGAVTFTLPAATRALVGWWYRFKGVADQSITVASSVASTLIALNSLTSSSVSASTGGQKIGAEIEVICIESAAGTFRWAASGISVGHTFTVA